jgi:hypothetical protein
MNTMKVADLMPGDLAYAHAYRDSEAKWLARLAPHGARIKAAARVAAQQTVDAEPGVPEAGVGHLSSANSLRSQAGCPY